MNPILASALILILRWLQFLGTKDVLSIEARTAHALQLIDDTRRMGDVLSKDSLISHGMSNNISGNERLM